VITNVEYYPARNPGRIDFSVPSMILGGTTVFGWVLLDADWGWGERGKSGGKDGGL
jgi:hypothetical protein